MSYERNESIVVIDGENYHDSEVLAMNRCSSLGWATAMHLQTHQVQGSVCSSENLTEPAPSTHLSTHYQQNRIYTIYVVD